MRIDQFESDEGTRKNDTGNRPWRKHAPALNKEPSNPNYPKKPFNYDDWMKSSSNTPKKSVEEDSSEIPEQGDTIRTKKMQMEGKVEAVRRATEGYEEVLFRIADGRLMRTPLENVIVVQKLADGDEPMMEERVDEISNEVLAKYKTAAGKSASDADKRGDYATGNKRFSGIVKATKKQFANDSKKKTEEGTMGGINRSAPAQDVSYEHVLDEVKAMWEQAQLNELSVEKLRAYKDAAGSSDVARHAPLRKVAKHVQGAHVADQKIRAKTGDKTGMKQPTRGTMEERLAEFLNVDEADEMGNLVRQQNPEKKTDEKKYNGWIIRWQLVPSKPGAPFKWMAWHEKKEPSTAKSGESRSPEQAYQDATAFINAGAGEERKYNTNKVAIDFNIKFSKEIVPHGEPFYSKIEDGFLIVSFSPKEGFSKSYTRGKNETGEELWMAPISTAEAQAQKLVPNGRYTLGSKEEIDAETSMFDIHFQSVAQSSSDKLIMREPGFTVAATRDH